MDTSRKGFIGALAGLIAAPYVAKAACDDEAYRFIKTCDMVKEHVAKLCKEYYGWGDWNILKPDAAAPIFVNRKLSKEMSDFSEKMERENKIFVLPFGPYLYHDEIHTKLSNFTRDNVIYLFNVWHDYDHKVVTKNPYSELRISYFPWDNQKIQVEMKEFPNV